MGDEQPTPGQELDADLDDTQAAEADEQVDETDDEDSADTSAAEPDRGHLQAAYTRSQQGLASIRNQLGLDKRASPADILAAVQQLQEAPATGDGYEDEEEEVDPRIAEAQARAWDAQMRYNEAIYGADFTKDANDLIATFRTSDDPDELMTALHGFVLAHSGQAAEVPTDDGSDEGAADQPLDIGASEGDRAPATTSSARSGGRPESGTTMAVRDIFKGLGIGSR